MTNAERLLLILVADALIASDETPIGRAQNLIAARHALDNEAHAAPQSAPQGGHGRWACPRCGHDLEASIALLGPEWKG